MKIKNLPKAFDSDNTEWEYQSLTIEVEDGFEPISPEKGIYYTRKKLTLILKSPIPKFPKIKTRIKLATGAKRDLVENIKI